MTETTVLVDLTDGIAWVTLNRPEARNALSLEMRQALEQALRGLSETAEVRVLVLGGAGEHFCAGGDVKLMATSRPTADEAEARVLGLNRAVRLLAEFRTPTLAMVDGFAVGAGCNLAIACDLVVAADRARFGQVFARLGLVPDAGGTWLLPRRVGLGKAKELVFTAEVIDAGEALRIGLVDRVVPSAELEARTRELAERLRAGPPQALAAAKSLLNRSLAVDLGVSLEWEAMTQGRLMQSEDFREGLAAFLERRAPRFRGT
jgi:2-(1,2-epoxy-1,2-dihydrophenyl)acetyl-CoA isomerase